MDSVGPHHHPLHLEIRISGVQTALDPGVGTEEHRDLDSVLDRNYLSQVTTVAAVIQGVPPAGAVEGVLTQTIGTLPSIRAVCVVSNAVHTPQDLTTLVALHRSCVHRQVQFSADFVLDAGANAFAALGRQPTSLGPILDASRMLRLKGVYVRWRVPVVSALAYRLEALFSLANDERVDAVLIPPSTWGLPEESPPDALDADARRFVRDFIRYRLLGDEGERLSPAREALYETLHEALVDFRAASPVMAQTVAVLETEEPSRSPGWGLRYERQPVWDALTDAAVSREAIADRWSRLRRTGARASEVTGVLAEGGRAVLQWARTTGLQAVRRHEPHMERPLSRVLVIGAYGGEHIGDTAILGGVLCRMSRRHGTKHAILMSQRPDHTRHLVPMLDVPVDIRVEDYRQSTVGELLRQVDAVVFAGGPLMDLPKQLVKHLYTVSVARRYNKPFIIAGIGAGPFVFWPSAWVARRLVLMADHIAVRTSADGRAPLVRDLGPAVGRDPAFDYLETRGDVLTRLPEVDRQWLERLLKDTQGRVTIGLNLRPVRSVYTAGAPAGHRDDYTRFVEARFEERLAESLRRLHQASATPPCFIFFPMNAIQFGMCDLRSAYRVKRLLRGDVDFRVWEGDASIDGIVALLRRLDLAITMRFHATIYALAQGRRVVGIDYRVGRRDKVAALLDDFGHADRHRRIDTMTTNWLSECLSGLSGDRRLLISLSDAQRPHDIDGSSLRPVARRETR
ncbi:MAG: polysaccharide pyruvyl transferase family protein [Vicinamibacterales bacterium]